DRVRVVEADLCAAPACLEAVGLAAETFHHVIANPPYLEDGRYRLPAGPIAAGAYWLPPRGFGRLGRALAPPSGPAAALTLILQADAMYELLAALDGRFGAVRILPMHARARAPAHRIIVRARKGSRAPMQLMPGLVLHGEGNAFLPAIEAILRDGRQL